MHMRGDIMMDEEEYNLIQCEASRGNCDACEHSVYDEEEECIKCSFES